MFAWQPLHWRSLCAGGAGLLVGIVAGEAGWLQLPRAFAANRLRWHLDEILATILIVAAATWLVARMLRADGAPTRLSDPDGAGGTRLFEAALAGRADPDAGYGALAIGVGSVGGQPSSGDPARARAIRDAIRAAMPGTPVELFGADVLLLACPFDQRDAHLERIRQACDRMGDGAARSLSLAFGWAGPAGRLGLRRVIEAAKIALEQARRRGCEIVEIGTAELDAIADNARLLEDLRATIAEGGLALHYQPKLHAKSNRIESLEALVRWQHPERGAISPAMFVPLAEDSGDIRELTLWVLDQACRDSLQIRDSGHDQLIYVNVSAMLVADDRFVADIIARTVATGARIGIEVTETACLLQPERALVNLARLADAGMSIAIDDYGVGLSSLTYLRQMPATELKIDMSFIRDLAESHRDPLIVRSTIDLAHGLGLKVTAEGVDKPETLALLKVMGCDYIQGYQVSPPMTLAACIAFLENGVDTDALLPAFAMLLAQGGGAPALARPAVASGCDAERPRPRTDAA